MSWEDGTDEYEDDDSYETGGCEMCDGEFYETCSGCGAALCVRCFRPSIDDTEQGVCCWCRKEQEDAFARWRRTPLGRLAAAGSWIRTQWWRWRTRKARAEVPF